MFLVRMMIYTMMSPVRIRPKKKNDDEDDANATKSLLKNAGDYHYQDF